MATPSEAPVPSARTASHPLVIPFEALPAANPSREFIGADHGGIGLCAILVDLGPGRGPALHRHDYDELIIVQEGRGRYTLGDDEREVGAGSVIVVPAGTPHAFVNTGDGPLRQIDVHASASFDTEWL